MRDRSSAFVLLCNPRAGGGRAEERLHSVQSALREAGAVFETVRTRGPTDATRLVRDALKAGTGGVAVVGGDGTVNEAVNGFFDRKGEPIAEGAWLGVLPAGTGGDFGRSVGVTSDPHAMVTRLLWAKPRAVDVGWARFRDHAHAPVERAFLNVASFGLSGATVRMVNDKPNKWPVRGAAYLAGALRARIGYRSRRVRLTLEAGEARELDVQTVAIANGRYFGGGMRIAPEADLEDGLLDVVTIEPRGLVRDAVLAQALFRGTVLSVEGVSLDRTSRILAEPADWAGPIEIDLDGESPGILPATFEVRPRALLLRA